MWFGAQLQHHMTHVSCLQVLLTSLDSSMKEVSRNTLLDGERVSLLDVVVLEVSQWVLLLLRLDWLNKLFQLILQIQTLEKQSFHKQVKFCSLTLHTKLHKLSRTSERKACQS